MDKPDYLISTPENVDLHLELAGVGNRVVAALIDSIAIFFADCILIAIVLGYAAYAQSNHVSQSTQQIVAVWMICILSLVALAINLGYFIIFEGLWHGQTPGKRFVGIRVIESNGQPVSWGAVIIRNLMRSFWDTLPMLYFGMIPMLLDKNERRFGDMFAGTLVIRERMSSLSSSDLKVLDGQSAADTIFDTGQISPSEYNILVTFLKRRGMMLFRERQALAQRLAHHFHNSLGLVETGDPPERFIEKVFIAYKQRADVQEGY